jgi:hypothetical protein
MEDIGAGQSGVGWIARSVETYRSVFAACGFTLSNVRFLNTKISRRWYESIDRWFISRRHQEGDPISFAMKCLIGLPMPITNRLDQVFVEKANLAKMVFQRTGPGNARSASGCLVPVRWAWLSLMMLICSFSALAQTERSPRLAVENNLIYRVLPRLKGPSTSHKSIRKHPEPSLEGWLARMEYLWSPPR